MSVAAVYACVRLLSESVAMLPQRVHRKLRKGGQEPAPNHPLAQVIEKRPNVWQTPFEFRRLSMVHMLLRGNAYSQIVRQGLRISALVPLNPTRMEVGQLPTGEIKYLYTKQDGGTVGFSQDDIFHLRSMSSDGLVGISPIEAARQAIGTALAAMVTQYSAKPPRLPPVVGAGRCQASRARTHSSGMAARKASQAHSWRSSSTGWTALRR
mgnify:CR=1 FL=1